MGDQNILFSFWYDEYRTECDDFVDKFIQTFNLLAERKEVDALPPVIPYQDTDEHFH